MYNINDTFPALQSERKRKNSVFAGSGKALLCAVPGIPKFKGSNVTGSRINRQAKRPGEAVFSFIGKKVKITAALFDVA